MSTLRPQLSRVACSLAILLCALPLVGSPAYCERASHVVGLLKERVLDVCEDWPEEQLDKVVRVIAKAFHAKGARRLTNREARQLPDSIERYAVNMWKLEDNTIEFAQCLADLDWRLSQLLQRPPVTLETTGRISAQIRALVEVLRSCVQPWLDASQKPVLDQILDEACLRLGRGIDDPLSPALKRPLTEKEIAQLTVAIQSVCQRHMSRLPDIFKWIDNTAKVTPDLAKRSMWETYMRLCASEANSVIAAKTLPAPSRALAAANARLMKKGEAKLQTEISTLHQEYWARKNRGVTQESAYPYRAYAERLMEQWQVMGSIFELCFLSRWLSGKVDVAYLP